MSDPAGTEWFDRPGGEPVELREPSPRWLKLAEEWSDAIGRAFPAAAADRARRLHCHPRTARQAGHRPAGIGARCRRGVDVPAGLESLGLVLRAREPGHRFFRPPAGETRSCTSMRAARGSDWEREHLLFRDQLRARPDLAAAYAQLKQDLSREVGSDRFAYTEGKTNFIRRVVEAAYRNAQVGRDADPVS